MGLCMSSGGAVGEAVAAAPKDTAMVLLPTGELREYPRPATAARVLEECSAAGEKGWFLCDADRMGFEGPVSTVGGAEELRAGQIYFVLPAGARRREEVAALAQAACSGTGRRRRGAVAPLVFSPPTEEQQQGMETFSAHKAAAPAPSVGKRRPLQRFASDLTAIPECEMISE